MDCCKKPSIFLEQAWWEWALQYDLRVGKNQIRRRQNKLIRKCGRRNSIDCSSHSTSYWRLPWEWANRARRVSLQLRKKDLHQWISWPKDIKCKLVHRCCNWLSSSWELWHCVHSKNSRLLSQSFAWSQQSSIYWTFQRFLDIQTNQSRSEGGQL